MGGQWEAWEPQEGPSRALQVLPPPGPLLRVLGQQAPWSDSSPRPSSWGLSLCFPLCTRVASARSPSWRVSGPLDPIAMPLHCQVPAGLHQAVEERGGPGQPPVPVPPGPLGTGSVLKAAQSSVLPPPRADSLQEPTQVSQTPGSGLGRPRAPGARTRPALLCRGETGAPTAGTGASPLPPALETGFQAPCTPLPPVPWGGEAAGAGVPTPPPSWDCHPLRTGLLPAADTRRQVSVHR